MNIKYKTRPGFTVAYTTTPNTEQVMLKVLSETDEKCKGNGCVFTNQLAVVNYCLLNGYIEVTTV